MRGIRPLSAPRRRLCAGSSRWFISVWGVDASLVQKLFAGDRLGALLRALLVVVWVTPGLRQSLVAGLCRPLCTLIQVCISVILLAGDNAIFRILILIAPACLVTALE